MTKMFIISDTELNGVVQKKQTDVLHFIYQLAQNDSSKSFGDLLNSTEEWIETGRTDFTHSAVDEDLSTPEGAAAFDVEAEDVQVEDYNESTADQEATVEEPALDYDYDEVDERPASETVRLEEVATVEDGVITPEVEESTEDVVVEETVEETVETEAPAADSTSYNPEAAPERPSFNIHKLLKEARSIDKS